jgi:S-adenosylmethionine hydrolase
MSARPVITLLTDFGLADPFVGMMKGVIAGICPDAVLVDLTHEVPPQDVFCGAFFLERAFRYFPPGTVHLCVVDPGVGTRRAPLAMRAERHFFVGPDNGLMSLAARRFHAVTLSERSFFRPDVSQTFHGRDLFAPVAAHLAAGAPLDRMGRSKTKIVRLAWPRPQKRAGGLSAEVVSVDRFGNLITNLSPADWRALRRPRLQIGDFTSDELSTSYGAAREGALLAVFGGYGLLEIAARNASAAEILRVGRGARVRVISRAPKASGPTERSAVSRASNPRGRSASP